MKMLLKIICGILFFSNATAQTAGELVRKGNELYRNSEFDKAANSYDEALAVDPANNTAKFNKANTDWKMNKPAEAIKKYEELAAQSRETERQARAFYNKGAILSKQKKLEESIEAYKNALRRDPSDVQARENLQKALLELKKNQPPPKKEDDKKKQQQKKQQEQPKMNKKEAEQKLKLLEQKERELQQRMQNQKTGSGTGKDW